VIGVAMDNNMSIRAVARPGDCTRHLLRATQCERSVPFRSVPDAVAPGTPVNLAGFALTNPFDTAIGADSGDIWALSVDPNAQISPLSLFPGQTGKLTLVITPNAPRGTHVRGFIGVDTFNFDTLAGDELINISYEYTVR
jgi:hypothetical protein